MIVAFCCSGKPSSGITFPGDEKDPCDVAVLLMAGAPPCIIEQADRLEITRADAA